MENNRTMDIQSSRLDEEVASQTPGKDALTYEETPPIEPIKEPDVDMFPPPKPRTNVGSIVTTLVVFILLFIVGFWLSGIVRQYAGNFLGGSSQGQQTPTPTPKTAVSGLLPTTTEAPSGVWNAYKAMNGKTQVPYDQVMYLLPPEVPAPACDGSTCASQGTYLPGGTRFTVALRGNGQVFPDYRGKVISDLGGIPFPLTEVIVDGIPSTEYAGTFTGKTVFGYVFTQMRGYMIPISEDTSFEINHYTPKGVASDFAGDDVIFNEIIKNLKIISSLSEKGGVPVSTITDTITPIATPTDMVAPGSPSATPVSY